MNKDNLESYLQDPEQHIPNGYYCYNENGVCPFWESKKGEYPEQEDGYCHFLGKSDWELNEVKQHTYILTKANDETLVGKTVAEVYGSTIPPEIDLISGKVIHFALSLIWDQCKECNVNNDVDDEYIESITINEKETEI